MLLIPESRTKPLTQSLLYKQIDRFFEEEGIRDKFNIRFIEVPKGDLPPKNFRSGRSWVSKEQIEQMADNIVEYLKSEVINHKSEIKMIAYMRGSYLEAVRLANKKLQATTHHPQSIRELFDDDELAQLKKKGILWMKVGLRIPAAFIAFRMKIRYMVMDANGMEKNEDGQLRLF